MRKQIGYRLFALVYGIYKPLPVKPGRVLCIQTHDAGPGSNVSLTVKALESMEAGYIFSYIRKKDTLEVKGMGSIRSIISFFLRKPYQLARAQIILMDNVFLPLAYIKRKKGVRVIQLWHGTGTIKRFGQHVNTGQLKELERRANSNITHLIVNSEAMRSLYADTFGIMKEHVYPIGLPVTDELLRRLNRELEKGVNSDKVKVYSKYQIPKGYKLVLYAPTFRDTEASDKGLIKRLDKLIEGLPENYYLGLRLHPFVAASVDTSGLPPRVSQMSFEADLNSLLLASDALITDYSSIIFEYCLTGKPMVFFAYDLEEFSDKGRGFYYDYTDFVPGPVAATADEVAKLIRENDFDAKKIALFRESNYSYQDGRATERLLKLINKHSIIKL